MPDLSSSAPFRLVDGCLELVAADRDEADRMVAYHLRRRASAERRIGVAYRPVAAR